MKNSIKIWMDQLYLKNLVLKTLNYKKPVIYTD